jgi:very-short-patch-repair endonuclease
MRFLRPPAASRRSLRASLTDAEALLWSTVRDRQLMGAKFRRQYSFGAYVLDFYCLQHRVAIEVDGSQHLTEEGLLADARRTAFLDANRVRVLRFTNTEVLRELPSVLEVVAGSLAPEGERLGVRGETRRPHEHPSPAASRRPLPLRGEADLSAPAIQEAE